MNFLFIYSVLSVSSYFSFTVLKLFNPSQGSKVLKVIIYLSYVSVPGVIIPAADELNTHLTKFTVPDCTLYEEDEIKEQL